MLTTAQIVLGLLEVVVCLMTVQLVLRMKI